VAIKILNESTGPKANVEFMDVSFNLNNTTRIAFSVNLASNAVTK